MGVRGGEGRGEASSNPAAKTTVAGNTDSRPHAVARARQLELAWQSSWRQETCPPLPPARIVVISRSLSLTCTELTAMSSSTCQARKTFNVGGYNFSSLAACETLECMQG